jgi:hypothetical protein
MGSLKFLARAGTQVAGDTVQPHPSARSLATRRRPSEARGRPSHFALSPDADSPLRTGLARRGKRGCGPLGQPPTRPRRLHRKECTFRPLRFETKGGLNLSAHSW